MKLLWLSEAISDRTSLESKLNGNPQEFHTKQSHVVTTLKAHRVDSHGYFSPLLK